MVIGNLAIPYKECPCITLPPDLSIEALRADHPSRPKNPKIAHVFHRARLIEHWGTGTLRIIEECEGTGVKPEFVAEMGVIKVWFIKAAKPAPVIDELELSPRQRKIIEYVKEHGKITNRECQKMFRISDRHVLKDIKILLDKGLITKRGSGRSTHYVSKSSGLVRD